MSEPTRRAYLKRTGALGGFGVALSGSSAAGHATDAPATQDGSWTTVQPLPVAQSDAAGGVVDGTLYYVGGFTSGDGLDATARAFAFDPRAEADGAWRRVEDAPRALWGSCGVATADRLFYFGGAPTDSPYGTGEPPTDAVLVYEPGDGWTDLTERDGVRCPYPNWAMRGVYDPGTGLIYCMGGGTNVTDRESATDHGAGSDSPGRFDESRIWTFDPGAEAVADPDLARMPRAKRWPAVALVEGDDGPAIHAIAGRNGSTGPTDSNFRFDVGAGEWSVRTPAPAAGNYGTTGDPVIDGRLYLTHGLFWSGQVSMDSYRLFCHRYDPVEDSFVTGLASPRYERTGPVDAVVDGTLYVLGGHLKRYDEDRRHECLTHSEAFTPPATGGD